MIGRPPLADQQGLSLPKQPQVRLLDVEASIQAVGSANESGAQLAAPRGAGAHAASTMSTNTRRPSLTAAALMTVRRACAVRPPLPITFP